MRLWSRPSMIWRQWNRCCGNIISASPAIIVEPMPNAGGMVPPAPGYLRGLRELTDRFGLLLLFDEIVTLRLGSGGLQEAEGVIPDYDRSGQDHRRRLPGWRIWRTRRHHEPIRSGRGSGILSHSGTFNGNNITMTAGLGGDAAAGSRSD